MRHRLWLGLLVWLGVVGWAEAQSPSQQPLGQSAHASPPTVTVQFKAAPLNQVLLQLAEHAPLDVVLTEPVDAPISIEIKDQPIEEVMRLITTLQGLEMREVSGVWVVASPAYWIEQAARQPLVRHGHTVIHRDATQLVEQVEPMLSARGQIQTDPTHNRLWIEDSQARIDAIKDRLNEMDQAPAQVLIESRIVIANRDFNRALGMRFGATRRDDDLTPSIEPSAAVDLPAAGASGQLNLAVLSARYRLDAELSALEATGEGQVISTPRIVVANRAEAFIQQGVAVPFEAVQSGQGDNAGAVSVQFREAALALRATPLILPDGRIQLDLGITQDTVGQIFQTGRGGSVPSIDTRQLGTRVWVEDGQTLVLGGIFQEQDNALNASVPILSSVPGLGRLFQRASHDDQRRELLIFITPTLLLGD